MLFVGTVRFSFESTPISGSHRTQLRSHSGHIGAKRAGELRAARGNARLQRGFSEARNAEEKDVQLKFAADRAGNNARRNRVQLSDTQRQQLLTSLLKIGWTRRGDFIVAPNETLCLPLVLMRTSELGEFRDGIARQCAQTEHTHAPLAAGALEDFTGVLEVLREFLATFIVVF